jgi:hypothetical protein
MSTDTGKMLAAYVVTRREGKDDWWTQIGTAFEHADGKGWNLVLQALPITGADGECKIVLRPPKSERDDRQDDRSTRSNGRQDNRRQTSSRRADADTR